jgi:hypothetical protein
MVPLQYGPPLRSVPRRLLTDRLVVDLRSAISSSACIPRWIALCIEAIDLKSCAAEAAPQRTLSGSESSTSLVKRVK